MEYNCKCPVCKEQFLIRCGKKNYKNKLFYKNQYLYFCSNKCLNTYKQNNPTKTYKTV